MKNSEREALASRGAYADRNPLGGMDIQLEPNCKLGFWDEFGLEFEEVLRRPSFSNEQASFAIRPRNGDDDFGFAMFSQIDHIICMNTLYVYPGMRGFGVGRRVLTALSKGRPLLAQVLPFSLRSKYTTWGVPVVVTDRDHSSDDVIVTPHPEEAARLMKLYRSCGWTPCVVAASPTRTYATTLKVSLNGFIHLKPDELPPLGKDNGASGSGGQRKNPPRASRRK